MKFEVTIIVDAFGARSVLDNDLIMKAVRDESTWDSISICDIEAAAKIEALKGRKA